MPADHERRIIEAALAKTAEINPQGSDGKWLETVVSEAAPFIKEWDIEMAWLWAKWPDRARVFPNSTARDVGVDVVARRRVDGAFIAIQCKSRKLDESERGCTTVSHGELTNFTSPASSSRYAEAWVISNGDVQLSSGAEDVVRQLDKPLKRVNITADLEKQLDSDRADSVIDCAHSENPDDPDAVQTKSSMQREAVAESVRILREHADSDSGGSPVDEARGRIILPCGTGKTRISLRIVEELTPPGEVSVVLCPSIALVAQIRSEYLQNRAVPLDVLAVCSDVTAGYDPKKEGVRNSAEDPTVDGSNVSADEVKGRVTTDAGEIAAWMRQPSLDPSSIKVLIGTYQSSARVSEALLSAGVRARVLIADEAHRTAGLKRRGRRSNSAKEKAQEERVRDFTVCHDQSRFPATFRVYQTATPRIYDAKGGAVSNDDWIVRSMDDETTFGVELYRKSYAEAVRNEWLSNYRIIALGINDAEAYAEANSLARNTRSKGRNKLTTDSYMKGLALALAMGGATQGGDVDIRSCIAFMNTVDKSKNMAQDLDTQSVKDWVSKWLRENADGRAVSDYSLEHLDASYNVAARETAKARLARADSENPHGIINVGIFGEGTDSPSLSAVAFLEPRKSPIDVVQAVGRAMRTAPGKKMGYIICPILIPPNADPETWLSRSDMEEGWTELGQILLALRAHDQRIEDELGKLFSLYLPKPPEVERSIIAVALSEGEIAPAEGGKGEAAPAGMESAAAARIQYVEYEGEIGAAEEVVERLLKGESMSEVGAWRIGRAEASYKTDEPTQVFTGKKNADGGLDIRMDTVVRDKPKPNAARGVVNIQKTKASARKIINGEGGTPVQPGERRRRRKREGDSPTRKTPQERAERRMQAMLLDELGDIGSAISVNLLAKSGLSDNRVKRDLNILEKSVGEAAHHLRSDGLLPALNRHFGLDRLKANSKAADGCTIAALLMMNAAMLHQRIVAGRWLPGVRDLATIKNDVDVVNRMIVQWSAILGVDFKAVLTPALDVIVSVNETGKRAGLERALRHIAAEAERIAETYADMGADHAGPLFNKVMGNQASDGAFFTRPVAASLAARLTLAACGDVDWTNPDTWREHKTIDPACGSGTLLAALLADMKRRAAEAGANDNALANLQRIAVERVINGLDINPVSLQLAASQLIAGNKSVRYGRMGLHLMPYGPDRDNPARASAGTLELLGQKAIVSQRTELAMADDDIASENIWDFELEDPINAARNARIVIMNPPFSNRTKMGEKFPPATQKALRNRADAMEGKLTQADPDMVGFVDKNSIRPLFVGVADHCLDDSDGILTMISPTIALTATSGFNERRILSQRFHIDTILTCHQPGNINLSQNTNINESVIVMRRHEGPKPPTRFINMDKLPMNEGEIVDFHHNLLNIGGGGGGNILANGWGEVSYWPAERIETGDWTPAIWRSPSLADVAYEYANHPELTRIADMPGVSTNETGRILRGRGSFKQGRSTDPDSFPVLKGKGADSQLSIRSEPNEWWVPKSGAKSETEKMLEKAGHMLITAGQDNSTARLTAVADSAKCVANGWMPVTGLSDSEAKAVAVFVNSTVGRLQLMRNPGRKLAFPQYSVAEAANIRIPNIKDARIQNILAACWERTKDALVPQFRDGECEVRRLWDEAVAEAMGWDADETAYQRALLHREPHVRGLGYNQYADAPEE